jgi:ADP-ribose pyrophosphatase YjhB (NUDIX family)
MPILCVDLIIEQGNSILLIKRKNNPLKDTWWFPGGRIGKGETIEETSIRKAREEVGLQCTVRSIIGIEDTYFLKTPEMEFDVHTFNIMVKMQAEQTSPITLDDDHCEFKWARSIGNDYPEILKKILVQLLRL